MAAKNSLTEIPESDSRSYPCETNYFCSLPVEIKLRILHYVDSQTIIQSVAQVNKYFNNLSKDRSLYQCYETHDFDEYGFKSLTELNHPLFKSHIKVLSTSRECFEDLDLREFTSLTKIIIYYVYDRFDKESLKHSRFPPNLKNIEVRNGLGTPLYLYEELLQKYPQESVSIKLEVLYIRWKEDWTEMLKFPADRYVIVDDKISTAENLQRLLVGELHYLLERNDISFSVSRWLNNSTNLLRHVPKRISKIEITLDCSDDVQRQAILSICRDCSSLEYLELYLEYANKIPEIETVASGQLQTLILQKRGYDPDVIMRCKKLITATRRNITLRGFDDIPVDVLSYLNPSVSSLTLRNCNWISDSRNSDERKLLNSLTLSGTPAAPILARIDPGITKLDLDYVKNECFAEILTVLRTLTSLKFFSINYFIITLRPILEALLVSKDSLRVIKFHCGIETNGNACETLQLLRRFPNLQYFYMKTRNCHAEFTTKQEIKVFFPTAIVYISKSRWGHHVIRLYL